MKQEKDGNSQTLFYDSYALFAIALGQDSYKQYASGIKIITTVMNLYETYYILLRENLDQEAEKFFERFLPFCIALEPGRIKEAARFRLLHKNLKLSYVDALGYNIAQYLGIPFLTGDGGFKSLSGVKFVE